ncbi:lipoate--protein ligase family protein [Sulfurimonas sp. HSL3-7]|uniref:lipoate--protein ligase family protein n=1 Tax=Sulfonitrofixus jiaomeiensis TaxID=3131938 RepID=UPI0031F93937
MITAKRWRLIESGEGSAAWNMAVDEALLESFKEGDMPILRLYGWEPALTLGRFSGAGRSVDLESTEAQGIACVRRISGGGILVHGGDLSYSLILPRNLLRHRGVKESYRYLCGFLVNLYEKLGQKASFAQELQLERESTNVCLAGNEPYDLLIGGRKMGGNAQRHTSGALFQHGTIPISLDEERFGPLFLEESGLSTAATLERLGIEVSIDALSELLKESFCESFGVRFVSGALRVSEAQRAGELLAQKYSQERWNLHAEHDQT